jgi:hypothetical protein
MAYGQVTVPTGSAILVVAQNVWRKSLIISNEGSSKIYIGGDSFITSATTISVASETRYTEDSGGQRMYIGNIYAISEDSTNDVRYWEKV